MRIIAGKFKGKKLFPPKDKNVRPTTDRIKETIFNILSSKNKLQNANVLDLFSGSGSLGIEAMSRGGSHVVFVDNSPESILLTKKNIGDMPFSCEVIKSEARLAIKKLCGKKFDLIFLDPPYLDNIHAELLFLIQKYEILGENGMIVFEFSSQNDLSNAFKDYIIDLRIFGSTSVAFLSQKNEQTISTLEEK
jgi:16S rRNA (guanine(966)-N(2))-methyltransferase RsmD